MSPASRPVPRVAAAASARLAAGPSAPTGTTPIAAPMLGCVATKQATHGYLPVDGTALRGSACPQRHPHRARQLPDGGPGAVGSGTRANQRTEAQASGPDLRNVTNSVVRTAADTTKSRRTRAKGKRMKFQRLLVGLAGAAMLLGAAPIAPAQAASDTCDGVWVVVDYGSIGDGTKTACATSFDTGTKALESAGFTVGLGGGFVNRINGKPAKLDINKAYWSYWQATVKADGSYSAWTYSQVSSGDYRPSKGDAEGWHYLGVSDTATGPSVTPPSRPAAVNPTAASTTASSAPSVTASTSPSLTPTQDASAAPAPVPADAGSGLVWLIVVAAVVVVGGLGLWWYRKGRRH